MKTARQRPDPLWYKDAIIYELHVKAFFDSNNDGIGDFPRPDPEARLPAGAGRHLPLAAAVLPVAAAGRRLRHRRLPERPPDYGTLEDFQAFLDAAHERGLQVMIELVINHTSDQHPWFQRARQAPPGSPERDFYVWSDTDQKYQRRADHLHRHRAVQLDLGSRSPRPISGTASSRTSPT